MILDEFLIFLAWLLFGISMFSVNSYIHRQREDPSDRYSLPITWLLCGISALSELYLLVRLSINFY